MHVQRYFNRMVDLLGRFPQMIIFSMRSLREHAMAIRSHVTPRDHVSPTRTPAEYLRSAILNTSTILTSRTCWSFLFDCGTFSYIWNAAENATTYVQLTFGIFFSELAQNMENFQAGKETYQIRFYVGHDGSMIRLAAGLGIGKNGRLRWPALGSEIVIEVRFFILKFFRSLTRCRTRSGEQGKALTMFEYFMKGLRCRLCNGWN